MRVPFVMALFLLLLSGCMKSAGSSYNPLLSGVSGAGRFSWSNGVTWSSPAPVAKNNFNSVVYGAGQFIVVGGPSNTSVPQYRGSANQVASILTSFDGVNWVECPPGTNFGLFGVAFGKGRYVAVGGLAIMSSTDGIAWTSQAIAPGNLAHITYADGKFVATGAFATIMTSHDGVRWAVIAPGNLDALNPINEIDAVTYGNGRFVAVGQLHGITLTSSDGVSWTSRTSGTPSGLRGVAFGNGLFVAVGRKGALATSPDGATWTVRTSGTASDLMDVVYGRGQFVAVGERGTTLTSSDGVKWICWPSGTPDNLNGITFGENRFVAVGDNNTILKN